MTQLTRRERRERERGRRGAQQRRGGGSPARAARPRWLAPAIVAALALALVLGLRAAGVFEANPASGIDPGSAQYAPVAGATYGTKQKNDGNAHVAEGTKVSYVGNPPTSGSHWSSPAPWGSYDSFQPNERTVHNLEHGGIVISYNGLTNDETALLKGIVSKLRAGAYRKIILQPNPSITDAKVAVAAWDWLLKVQSVDEVQIIQFVRSHYDGPDAPEPGVP